MREIVRRRDRGVCAECGLDAEELRRDVESIESFLLGEHPCNVPWWRRGGRNSERGAFREWLAERGYDAHRTTFWDVDHIRPVWDGGGACGLENLRTLCVICHKRVTAEGAARRAEAKRVEEEWKRSKSFRQILLRFPS